MKNVNLYNLWSVLCCQFMMVLTSACLQFVSCKKGAIQVCSLCVYDFTT